MEQRFTLSELNATIRETLLDAFPGTIWVVAEISELKENRSGHCYIELIEKEENTIKARSRAMIWSYTYRILRPYFETSTGQLFTQGIKVLLQVTVEYHPIYGLSLNIKDIDPAYTLGDMALQRKEIIDRLRNDGVLDMNKELVLPPVPQKIAVISSATAAGYQDFMNQLEHNQQGFKFYTHLFEAYMQGNETVNSIINALDRIFQYEDFFDAVVIIRGGGATADLNSFDNYNLAINITQFPLPVITGIGHEKDDTVIDLVAHTRLKTPTAVAEFLINKVDHYYNHLCELKTEMLLLSRGIIEDQSNRLEKLTKNFAHSLSGFIQEKQNKLGHTGNRLQKGISNFSYKKQHELNQLKHHLNTAVSVGLVETGNIIRQKKRLLRHVAGESLLKQNATLQHFKDTLVSISRQRIIKEKGRIEMNQNTVYLLNPENVLKRGFTLTLKNGKIVKSAQHLAPSDEIETKFADGKVQSKIIKKTNHGNQKDSIQRGNDRN